MKEVNLQTPKIDSLGQRDLQKPDASVPKDGSAFQEVLRNIQPGVADNVARSTGSVPGAPPAAVSSLKFSSHAVERMRLRGLSFDQQALAKIQGAVDRAAAKGAQNALVLSDAAALIVSVKNNVVVTVMDKSQLKENVFTNIDSAVFA